MASRLTKLRILVSRGVILMLLSASSSGLAAKPRCYWCGPLAEQVHRSQRAPPCDNFLADQHETECDPGYSHCAIVATSPPYAESRLCVKFYQDECYSLYCNSTRTWRMVCACQGDLCNGPHTDRETEAFALIPKFPKNKSRNKRSLSNVQPKALISVKTKNAVDENTIIVMGKEPNDTQMLNDQPIDTLSNEESTSPSDDLKIELTPTPKKDEDNYMIVHGALTSVDKNKDIAETEYHDGSKKDVEPTMPAMKDRDVTTKMMNIQTETTKVDTNETKKEKADDNTKTDKLNVSEVAKDHGNEKSDNNKEIIKDNADINKKNTQTNKPVENTTKPSDIIKENHNSITSTVKPTTIEISVEVQTSATIGKMPPAENLQQNTTPTKAMEITTMGTIATTDSPLETTTSSEVHNDTQKKSGGVQNVVHIVLIVICILAPYCV